MGLSAVHGLVAWPAEVSGDGPFVVVVYRLTIKDRLLWWTDFQVGCLHVYCHRCLCQVLVTTHVSLNRVWTGYGLMEAMNAWTSVLSAHVPVALNGT